MEKKITIEEINPVEIYGVNNRLFNLLASRFPKLKAIARGDGITLVGTDDDIAAFEEKFNALMAKRARKNNLTEYDVDELFDGVTPAHNPEIGMVDLADGENIIVYGNDGKPVRARTKNQKRLVKEYYRNDLLFAVGPAGTGKTYTAIALAVRALKNREVKRLILTRPAVEAGERLGFLPGDLKDKLDPYLQPLYDALQDMIPPKKLQSFMEDGTIQIAPLAYMRGRTLDRAFVILDEAQNTSLGQLKMFLTRIGCRRQVHSHRRRNPDRPSQQEGFRPGKGNGTGTQHPRHQHSGVREGRHSPPSPGDQDRRCFREGCRSEGRGRIIFSEP